MVSRSKMEEFLERIFEIKNAKIALGISIFLFSVGIFIENADVAILSTLKAKKSQIELDRDLDYGVEKPIKPISEVRFLKKPAKPYKDAELSDIVEYEEALQKYESRKEKLTEEYNEKLTDYNLNLKEYRAKLADMNRDKTLSRSDYKQSLTEVRGKIRQKKIDINKIYFPLFLRFMASLIFLIAFVGILRNGDQYEKLGILILTGFALKTIIGL